MASRKAEDLEPHLTQAYTLLREEYETLYPGRQVILTCTYRSPQEQAELYASGRTRPGPILTNCDGKVRPSRHNTLPAEAFDVAILVCGKAVWDESYFAALGAIAAKIGLKWGGTFQHFKDCPHFEM